MKYIKSHYRAGYVKHNKDGSITYVNGTYVKGHYISDSSYDPYTPGVKKTDRSYTENKGSSYYSEYDKLHSDYSYSDKKTQRLRVKDGDTVIAYSYDPTSHTTTVEEKDWWGVTKRTEYGNTVPVIEKKKKYY